MQRSRVPFVFASAALCGACRPHVEAEQMNGAWVFSYARGPSSSDEALHSGRAAVVDGCLQVGDAVVVWYEHHLDTVEDVIGRIDKGETVDLRIGGGGIGLDEGSTVDDFPRSVREHCSPSEIWYSGDFEIQFGKDG
jgi:hypothetical protein